MQTTQWLAMAVSQAVTGLGELGQSVVAIRKTRAPSKQQDDNGLWRVVAVRESAEGVVLTVAWQKVGVALRRDVELGQ